MNHQTVSEALKALKALTPEFSPGPTKWRIRGLINSLRLISDEITNADKKFVAFPAEVLIDKEVANNFPELLAISEAVKLAIHNYMDETISVSPRFWIEKVTKTDSEHWDVVLTIVDDELELEKEYEITVEISNGDPCVVEFYSH